MNDEQTESTDDPGVTPMFGALVEPFAVIQLALRSREEAKARFPNYRLSQLVTSRLELDELDMEVFSEILELGPVHPSLDRGRPFDLHLRHVLTRYRLRPLFSDDGPGPYHHAIRPAGYDFDMDMVIPTAMEKWRADYRAMADHRQMLAASIIWLYRGGKDRRWLRRVPCTWHAADALHGLRSSRAIADWARLFGLYPGW